MIRNTLLSLATIAALASAVPASASDYGYAVEPTPQSSQQGYVAGYYAWVVNVSGGDVLNVRAWPAARSRKVGALGAYSEGIYVERCIARPGVSDWCKIDHGHQTGWVNADYLARQH